MELELVLPTEYYYKKIIQYKYKILRSNASWEGTGCLKCYTVKDFIEKCNDWHKGENIPTNFVPTTEYLCVRKTDNKIVGMVNIRHTIDHEYLSKYGGHISYGIVPDERKKGYGKEILYLALAECSKMGLERVLITCTTKNIASQKCILANGGEFESHIKYRTITDNTIDLNRYWIDVPKL